MSLDSEIRTTFLDIQQRNNLLQRLGLTITEPEIESTEQYQNELEGFRKINQARPHPPPIYDPNNYYANSPQWSAIKPSAIEFEQRAQSKSIGQALDRIAQSRPQNYLLAEARGPFYFLRDEYHEQLGIETDNPVKARLILSAALRGVDSRLPRSIRALKELSDKKKEPGLTKHNQISLRNYGSQAVKLSKNIAKEAQEAYDSMLNYDSLNLFVRSTDPATMLRFLAIGPAISEYIHSPVHSQQ